jgi:hypothetical protein
MSQIATLQVIPSSSEAAIRAAVDPRKAGWFGKTKDVFWETLHELAPDVLNLQWSGYAMIVLFEFLREQRGFDFAKVDGHPLADFLSKSRRSYFAVFEPDVAQTFAQQLTGANLSEPELAKFANGFSETDEADAGKPLLVAARSLSAALAQVKPGSFGLLHVG